MSKFSNFNTITNNPTNQEIYRKLQTPEYTRDTDPNYKNLLLSIYKEVLGEGELEVQKPNISIYKTKETTYSWDTKSQNILIDAFLYKDKVNYQEFIESLYILANFIKMKIVIPADY